MRSVGAMKAKYNDEEWQGANWTLTSSRWPSRNAGIVNVVPVNHVLSTRCPMSQLRWNR